jgi:hypothetical protein
MGLFSDIVSAVGNAAGDVGNFFDGGNNPQKKQQNNNNSGMVVQPRSLAPGGPISLQSPQPQKPQAPVFNMPLQNNANLTAAPVQQPDPNSQPPAQHASLFHDLTHNPITNIAGSVAVKPFLGAAGGVAADVGTPIANAITGQHMTPEQAVQNTPMLRAVNNFAEGPQRPVPFAPQPDITSPRQLIPNALMTAANIGSFGLEGLAEKGAAGIVAKTGLSDAVKPYIAGALTGGAVNPVYSGAQTAQQGGNPAQIATSALKSIPVGVAAGGSLPIVGKVLGPVISKVLGREAGPADATASLAADDAAGIGNNDVTPAEPPPPETGTKPISEAPTNAPPEENAPPPAAPNAPESGVKPVEQPAAPTIPTVKPIEQPIAPITETPPTAVTVPPEVTAAQDAAQQTVNKTAENIPKPVAAPETSAPAISPAQAAAVKAAESPTQAAVDAVPSLEKEVPQYDAPLKNGKASVPGSQGVPYTTGDPNLDKIVNDSLISHKGTSATADQRTDALAQHGITKQQVTAIRNVAVKNVDKQTGQLTPKAVQQIKDILTKPDEAPVTSTAPPEAPKGLQFDTKAAPAEIPKTPEEQAKLDSDTNNFGHITNDAIAEGEVGTDEKALALQNRVEQAAENYAKSKGLNYETVMRKSQNPGSVLTDDERDVATRADAEMSRVRQRQSLTNPSSVRGNINKVNGIYHPLQDVGTEYTPKLVNEETRAGNVADPDFSTKVMGDYVRRYTADDGGALAQETIGKIEKVPVRDSDGNVTGYKDTGVKVNAQDQAKIEDLSKQAIAARDKLARATNPDEKNVATKESNQALNKLAMTVKRALGSGTNSDIRAAKTEINSARGNYHQTPLESNMLSNPVSRLRDIANNTVNKVIDKTVGHLTGRIADKITGEASVPRTAEGQSAARQWSRSATTRNAIENAKTNADVLVNGTRNPLAKISGVQRTGTTFATSLSDPLSEIEKRAYGTLARQAEDSGLTSKEDINAYIGRHAQSAQFQDTLKAVAHNPNMSSGMSGAKDSYGAAAGGAINKGIEKGLAKVGVPTTPARGISRAVAGFGRTTGALTQRALETASGGTLTGLRGLSELKGAVTDADRLKATTTIQQALKDAATAGVVAPAVIAGIKSGTIGYTGDYPKDPRERAQWAAEGKPSNEISVKVDGHTIYLSPSIVSGPGGLVSVVANAANGGSKNPASALGSAYNQISQNFGADSTGGLITGIGDAMQGDTSGAGKAFKQIPGSLVSAGIPGEAGLKFGAQVGNPVTRDTSLGGGYGQNLLNQVKNGIPGRYGVDSLPAKLDAFGNPIQNPERGTGSSIVTQGANSNNQVENEAARLNVFPANTSTETLKNTSGGSVSLTPTQKASLNQAVDQAKQNSASILINSPLYQSASDADKKSMLGKVYSLNSSATANQWAAQNGVKNVKTNGNSINTSIDSGDQSALTQASMMTKGQKAVWLQDNNNAASYYNAEYNNKVANKTLTTPDQDTNKAWSGDSNSLKVQALVADTNKQNNVSQSLIQLYHDTTKGEYEKMTGSDKTALAQYAAELNKNGVVDKFGVSTGTSSGSGSGGKSLGAAITLSSTKASNLSAANTVKYTAPTLKAYAPATAKNGNPFIRSITSSAGVK